MSRTIKFRAWLKPRWDDDEEANKMYYDIQNSYDNLGAVKPDDPMTSFESWFIEDVAIVEQYTGLKDENGKEIYEGDIVNISSIIVTDDSAMACIIDTNSIVYWDDRHARWDVKDVPEDEDWDYRRRRYFAFTSEDREGIEVVGNIHENLNLLEKKEEKNDGANAKIEPSMDMSLSQALDFFSGRSMIKEEGE